MTFQRLFRWKLTILAFCAALLVCPTVWAEPVRADTMVQLIELRNRIRMWADKCCRRDGLTPWQGNQEWMGDPEASGDGDSILYSAILYYSGEPWAGETIRQSLDAQGELWRSPYRVKASSRSGKPAPTGIERFSQDHMLGVLLYLITEFKYRQPAQAREFAMRWIDGLQKHLSHGEFALCQWSWGNWTSIDACALEGCYQGPRGTLIRRVLRFVSGKENIPKRPATWTDLRLSREPVTLGDRADEHKMLSYLDKLCNYSKIGGKFHCHLLSVVSLLFQELGEPNTISLDSGFKENPFALWVNNQRQADQRIAERTLELCSKAQQTQECNQKICNIKDCPCNDHRQWIWARSDREGDQQTPPPWFRSMGWDCIAMINLIVPRNMSSN